MKLKVTIFCFFVSCISLMSQSKQNNPELPFDKADYQERLTIFTNASRFIPGERILFALDNRMVNGDQSFVSKVCYIELIDAEKQSLLRTKVELIDGKGQGHLYLPSFLETGTYSLIAYTAWMQNYSLGFIPQQDIQIINPYNLLPNTLISDSVKVTFYPESQGFILDESNDVFYEIHFGPKDSSRDLDVRILDDSGSEIKKFTHDGSSDYGKFQFKPNAEGLYTVILSDKEGHIFYDELAVRSLEYKVALIDDTKRLTFSNLSGKSSQAFLVNWNDPRVTTGLTVDTSLEYALDENDWPSGLSYAYFEGSENGRFFYHKSGKAQPEIEIHTDKKIYQNREKVSLTLNNTGDSLELITVSVRKVYERGFKEEVSSETSLSMLGHLNDWLISEPPVDLSPRQSDLVYPDYRGQLLKGKTVSIKADQNQHTYLATVGSDLFMKSTSIDSEGNFYLLNYRSYREKDHILFSPRSEQFTLKESYLDDHSFVNINSELDRTNLEEWIKRKSIDVQIENAYFEYKEDSILDVESESFLSNRVIKSYNFEDYTRFPSVREIIIEIIQDLRIREKGSGWELTMPYLETEFGNVDTVLVMLDGIPMEVKDFLKVDPSKFKSVDLMMEQLKLGAVEYRGVASFHSLDGDGGLIGNSANYKKIEIKPLQPRVSYYQPGENPDPKMPDHRDQLLWEVTSLDNQSELGFYTSDLDGTYQIIVQGKSQSGLYFALTESFQVK